MATFGNTTGTGYAYATIAAVNYIRGWAGAPASNGTADSITIKIGAQIIIAHNMQCTLYEYDASDNIGNLIATTESKTVSATNTEYTFNVSSPKPTLVASTNYFLLCGVDTKVTADYRTRLICDTTTGSLATVTGNAEPVTWSDPMTGESFGTGNLYIYCTYTESVAAVDVSSDAFLNTWYYDKTSGGLEQHLNVDGW